ncbi:hypothetical protein KI387_019884 [Taxus chinensis]|uniref:F-box domain-containing protein n=1 Tax=Taxus chinensis TaxID=29808 RepID=A0AA38GAV6_TAXCH|nr:hypothetical protein KI387_019884 [Taxus chinensis]
MGGGGAKICSELPEEIVLMILAKLPCGSLPKMRGVCKAWKEVLCSRDALAKIYPDMEISSSPAFLLQFRGGLPNFILEGSSVDFRKLPSSDMGRVVEIACKGIYCCSYGRRSGARFRLWVCNPGTKTYKRIPYPSIITRDWDFIGMSFNFSTKKCDLVLGLNFHYGHKILEMYNSKSNAWTSVSMTVEDGIHPIGVGVFSKGKYYWMQGRGPFSNGEIVQLNVQQNCWIKIACPQYSWKTPVDAYLLRHQTWALTGCEGRIILVNMENSSPCMWKLREGDEYYTWSPVHIKLPKPVFQVAVNFKGWVLAVGEQLLVYNAEGAIVRTAEWDALHPNQMLSLNGNIKIVSAFAFECNNVCWPLF